MIGGLLVVVGLLAAFRLAGVAADLRDARDRLVAVDADLEAGRLAPARDGLQAAQTALNRANGGIYGSVVLDLAGGLPVVSQNLVALRDSVAITLDLVNGGRRVLDAAAPLERPDGSIEVPLAQGALPLDVLEDVQVELEATAGALPGSAERPGGRFLLGPVADLQGDVYDEAIRRRDQLDTVGRAIALLTEMAGADGDRRYLIAVANTAEMRGTGGMILNYGVLESSDGTFRLGEFGEIDELLLDGPVEVDLPADYLARWDGFNVTELWRNANVGADFTVVAPALEEMYSAATGQSVDGVIQIDPSGLAAVLAGTRPVEVPGLGPVDAANVVALTLNEAYTLFPDREARQEVLSDVAEEVFRTLLTGDYPSLRPLADSLVEAVAGRHLLVHASSPAAERQLRYFDVDGDLPKPSLVDALHLTVQNVSANKLDYYLDTTLEVSGRRPVGEVGEITAEVVLTNSAPPGGEPPYVFGPFDDDQVAGLYRGVVSLYVPTGTFLRSAGGDPTSTAAAEFSEDGHTVVSFQVDVPAGETRRVALELGLPARGPDPYRLGLVPQPRVRPTQVVVALDLGRAGMLDQRVEMTRSWILAPGSPPVPASGPGAGTDER